MDMDCYSPAWFSGPHVIEGLACHYRITLFDVITYWPRFNQEVGVDLK